MKTLIAYYSRTGQTRRVANELAAALGADVEELKDGKSRSGPIGFIMSGREAMTKRPVELAPLSHEPGEYDTVVVGSPIWAGTICTPVRTFLAQHKGQLKNVAWFCTAGSIDPKYAEMGFEAMTEESGMAAVATLGMGRKEIKGEHTAKVSSFAAAVKAHT